MRRAGENGVTLVEVAIVISIVAILASAFVTTMVPMMNFFFYHPESSRVNKAAADVLDIILDGDAKAKGLRFTGPPCVVPTGGSDTITTATASTLTYNYALSDTCGTGGTSSVSVAIVYDSGSHTVTRSVNGGTAEVIPYYATSASGIKIDPPASTNFFRYYDAADTELSSTPTVTAIMRVDVTVNATSGTGAGQGSPETAAGQILMKGGTAIKRYTT